MRTVTVDELLPLGVYENVRPTFRQRMIAHKKTRRLILGPEVSMVFEDHDTVLLQIQEMLRAERISDPRAVQYEVETYNELVPPDGALLATLMIEVEDPNVREQRRFDYVGLERAVFLELGSERVAGTFAPEGLQGDKVAVVQYVRFDLPERARALLLDPNTPVRLAIEHPRYAHSVVLGPETRASLANDLDPLNARKRAQH